MENPFYIVAFFLRDKKKIFVRKGKLERGQKSLIFKNNFFTDVLSVKNVK